MLGVLRGRRGRDQGRLRGCDAPVAVEEGEEAIEICRVDWKECALQTLPWHSNFTGRDVGGGGDGEMECSGSGGGWCFGVVGKKAKQRRSWRDLEGDGPVLVSLIGG